MAIETYFKNIADAIREKTGASAVITPGNMPDEIRSIKGGIDSVEPYYKNFKKYYISGNNYISDGNTANNSYIYAPFSSATKCVLCTTSIIGNVLRVGTSNIDPTTLTGQTIRITPLLTINEGSVTINTPYTIDIPAGLYTIVYKGYQNSESPEVLLFSAASIIGD